MKHEKHNPLALVRLLRWIHEVSTEGAYIFAGCPSHWRTRDGDCDADPAFDQVWQNVDSVSLQVERFHWDGLTGSELADVSMVRRAIWNG